MDAARCLPISICEKLDFRLRAKQNVGTFDFGVIQNQPMLFTQIQVYQIHILRDYDSGLTCPRMPLVEGAIAPGVTIQFVYEPGSDPRLPGNVINAAKAGYPITVSNHGAETVSEAGLRLRRTGLHSRQVDSHGTTRFFTTSLSFPPNQPAMIIIDHLPITKKSDR